MAMRLPHHLAVAAAAALSALAFSQDAPPIEIVVDRDDVVITTSCRLRIAYHPIADVNGNGTVEFNYMLAILATWGDCSNCPTDVDGDGVVGFSDVLATLAAFGPC